MCGFVAWFDSRGGVDRERLVVMRETLRHRGPDDEGLYVTEDRQVGLAFRRLAILDLSAAGRQPMTSADRTVWLVFNGEIYNAPQLRCELEAKGHTFRSRTDTEVLLAAYTTWGHRCVERLAGMFAFVVWDSQRATVFAARDRLGIKPLYFCQGPDRLLLASEMKPLVCAPGFDRTLDRRALRDYLGYGYIRAPRTIFAAARSLPPAHTLSWIHGAGEPVVARYWDPARFLEAATVRTEAEAADELEARLSAAVRRHLVSDVPLGAFLSGGVDSSLVVALMRQVSGTAVQTFTIGSADPRHDETVNAAAVARHLGVRHTVLQATEAEARQVLPLLPEHWDEPFADSSQIPTLLVSRLTRAHVTVALSGDGGDELFGGYRHYAYLDWLRHLWAAPAVARTALGALAAWLPDGRPRLVVGGLATPDPLAFADYLNAVFRSHEREALLARDARDGAGDDGDDGDVLLRLPAGTPYLQQLMLRDLVSYLPYDILTKVDRASMAASLEARVPLLDHEVVEFALGLPLALKRGKRVLRRVLHRHVPAALVERPKQGFTVPLDRWLRGELRPLLHRHLEPERLARQGLFEPAEVARHLQRFETGRQSARRVWSLLAFQMWWDRHVDAGTMV